MRRVFPFLLIAIATFGAYAPVWHGTPVWDDDAHLTPVVLQTLEGLQRIWFDIGATQQYYPLTHSAFWLQSHLWGADTTGYHLVNIALHVMSAGLVGLILVRLRLPGAWMAAAVFALHPIQVESVAWMSELKNVLSGAFSLGAVWCYLQFDESRRRAHYLWAITLFFCALLSKTVTAMVPLGLVAILWWSRERLTFTRDLRPLIPWVTLGGAAGLSTAWIEHNIIGAQGAAFDYSLIERGLIAGRALWFYAWSLVWPAHLTFNYPRWLVSETIWWQYLFPLAALAVGLLCWRLRERSRGPSAALGWYGVLLFPALGFFNVYPFRYSFVADHFQYLAGLGLIVLLTTATCGWLRQRNSRASTNWALALLVCVPLVALTWQQSGHYTDAPTLYRATLERNPESWLSLNNLGTMGLRGPLDSLPASAELIERAVALNPDNAEARSSLGFGLTRLGRLTEARPHLEAAIRLDPTLAGARNNLGVVEQREGRIEAALAHYQEAVRLDPSDADARRNLGALLAQQGQLGAAEAQLDMAFRLAPTRADILNTMGLLSEQQGRLDDAANRYERALSLDAALLDAVENLAIVRMRQGRYIQAETRFREILRLAPTHPTAGYSLATAVQLQGRLEDAVPLYQRALTNARADEVGRMHNDMGVVLAQLGRLKEAVTHFREAVRLAPDLPDARRNLDRALTTLGGGR